MSTVCKKLIFIPYMACLMLCAILCTGCGSDKQVYVAELADILSEDGNIITDVAMCPDAKEIMEGVIGAKISSNSPGETVHPGDEVTFAFVFQNNSRKEVSLEITDVVPDATEYISGCDGRDGKNLVWKLTIPGGKSASVSYVVKILEDMSLCENGYVYSEGKVLDQVLNCHKIYIRRTFNEYDQRKIVTGIKALKDSEFGGLSLAKWIYQVAFSKNCIMEGTPEELLELVFSGNRGAEELGDAANLPGMVAPTLWGGKAVNDSMTAYFPGERAVHLRTNDLITGDLLLVQKDSTVSDMGKVYIYDGSELFELLNKGARKADTLEILASLPENDRYVVLRPSMALMNMNYTEAETELTLTVEQEALIATAEAYILRGERIQYDDKKMGPDMEYRWQKGIKAPEDYTLDEWGYVNCAVFTNDVYQFALGYDIKMYTTEQLINSGNKIRMYYYRTTGAETEAEKKTVEKDFRETIEVGDIIVIRRRDGSGHALLYVGNGNIIHSTGKSYNVENSYETYEPTIRYKNVADLFDKAEFDRVIEIALVRPLNTWSKDIPEVSANRIKNMQGIVAEKLSSHTSGMTVSPGEEVTFMFSVYNSNDYDVTVDISDVVPANTTYVSGAEKEREGVLAWKLKISAGEMGTASYTVKVAEKESLSEVECIYSDAGMVGGIPVNCSKVYIKRTLNADEQAKLKESVEEYKSSSLEGFELANAIYEKAFAIKNIFSDVSFDDVAAGVFDEVAIGKIIYRPGTDNVYTEMLAPTLYGGQKCFYSKLFESNRTRLARQKHLIIGDILLAKNGDKNELYIYNGECFLDMYDNMEEVDIRQKLEEVLAYQQYFAVLRPSAVME